MQNSLALHLELPTGKKVYFISDLHLGMFPEEDSRRREKELVRWLESIQHETAALFLLGDTFDYWYEFRKVVPRGFVRFLAQIASFTDSGIPVHIFSGNHDVWMFGYLAEETGMQIHHKPLEITIQDKKFLLGHGDGLGPGDYGYKLMKWAFRNKVLQYLFSTVFHPNFSMSLGQNWSKSRQRKKRESSQPVFPPEQYQSVRYSREILTKEHFDYFIFGHQHHPLDIPLNNGSRFINTGDWIRKNTYAVFDGQDVSLQQAPGFQEPGRSRQEPRLHPYQNL